jgi:hypothetical protein
VNVQLSLAFWVAMRDKQGAGLVDGHPQLIDRVEVKIGASGQIGGDHTNRGDRGSTGCGVKFGDASWCDTPGPACHRRLLPAMAAMAAMAVGPGAPKSVPMLVSVKPRHHQMRQAATVMSKFTARAGECFASSRRVMVGPHLC